MEFRIKRECSGCDSTNFIEYDGKTFCVECNLELQSAKQLLNDYRPAEITQRLTTTAKAVNEKNKRLPTSWECFNQILCQLASEVEYIGCTLYSQFNPDYKLTVLQLWAAYLQYHKKAFFSKEPTIPQFGIHYKQKDVQILYEISPKKKKQNRSKPNVIITASDKRRQLRKLKDKVNNVELNLTINQTTGQIQSEKPKLKFPFTFTSAAKKRLKSKMDEEHILEHEENPLLPCHKFRRIRHIPDNSHGTEVARSVLYCLLYLALNHLDEEIQLGDLIRFLREGYVTYHNIADVSDDPSFNTSFKKNYGVGGRNIFPSHDFLRRGCFHIVKEIGFQLKIPNLSGLCKRYLKELCLPPEIGNLIDVLLYTCPPKMDIKMTQFNKNRISNFEGRAMSYILFILKLLFGLDDKRENLISLSSRALNCKINELNIKNKNLTNKKQLFVWNDWVEYIEMRNDLLIKYNFPTAAKSRPNTSTTEVYLEHLLKFKNTATNESKGKPELFQHVKKIFRRKYDLADPDLESCDTKNASDIFSPSLTPKRCKLENLQFADFADIFIPEFLTVKHENFDIEPFLKPSKLKSFLRQHQMELEINKLSGNEKINFISYYKQSFESADLGTIKYCNFDFNTTTSEWLKNLEEKKIKQTKKDKTSVECLESARNLMQSKLMKIREESRNAKELKKKNHLLRNQQQATESSKDETNESPDGDLLTNSKSDKLPDLFDCFSSDDENDSSMNISETVTLSISNFDYWMLFGQLTAISHDHFISIQKKLPKSFQWLLKQGADLIENHEIDLWEELMIVENYFVNCLKPFNEMSDELLFEPKNFKIKGSDWQIRY